MESQCQRSQAATSYSCLAGPSFELVSVKELGMDSRFAEIAVLLCRECRQHWLRYFYEVEAVTASARWYLGAITLEQASELTAENARAILEELGWYYYGGSYYQGQSGRTAGKILLGS